MKNIKLYKDWLNENYVDVELPPTDIEINKKDGGLFKYNYVIVSTVDIPTEFFKVSGLSPRLTFPMIMEGIYDTDKFGKVYMTFDYVEPGVHYYSGYFRFLSFTYLNFNGELTRYNTFNLFKSLIKHIVFEKMKINPETTKLSTVYSIEEINKEEGEI